MRLSTCLKYYCFFLPGIALLSCGQEQNDKVAFKEIGETLALSTEELNRAAKDRLTDLNDKLVDYQLKELAAKWLPQAERIHVLSGRAGKQIDSLRQIITKENYAPIIKQAAEIYQSYISSVLDTDPELKRVFEKEAEKATHYDHYNSPALAPLFLDKLQFDISHLNALGIAYCNSRTAWMCGLNFRKIRALVGQSSSILTPGQTLEISAGIGDYSSSAAPKIFINNQLVPTDDFPQAVAKIKVPTKPGNYRVPVEINYVNPEGEKMQKTFKVEYRVVREVE